MSDETAESLSGSFYTEANGWVRVHVEGDPSSLGFQHGYHLASELDDTLRRIRSYVEATCGWSWIRFREVSKKLYDAKVPCEYRQEMEGIAKGANTRLRNRGIWGRIEYADILALNGFFDSMFYYNWTKVLEGERPQGLKGLGHCSAFVASGKATVDGRIVLAHNMWLNYDLANWNILLSLHPLKGHKIFMQTMPGSIQGCGVDWYINSGGLMVTNTTLTGMKTFNQDGVPYFVRARRGIQHAD
ncbi:MAG: C45 family autoproteolytic acyltransferase/hydrolase, partial [Candidatus Bathyarchaeia archaeon]